MEEERNYVVYLHVNKENDKTYVGITCQKPEKRWGYNGNGYTYGHFKNAIKKYGWDSFEHIILFENKTQEEAEYLERLYIKILLSNNQTYGYNIENGGNGRGRVSETTKQKLSEYNKGRFTKGDSPSAKKVICNNIIYECLGDCADEYNIKISTMSNWLTGDNRMPQEFIELGLKYLDSDIIIRSQNEKRDCRGIKVVCDNTIFNSVKKCADFYGINRETMNGWLLNNNKMPIKFKDLGLKYYEKSDKIFNYKPYEELREYKKVYCDGMIFDSIVECAKYYDVKRRTLNGWLLNQCRTPQKFIDLGLRYYIEENDNIE